MTVSRQTLRWTPLYEQAKDRAKNGEVDEVKWVEIDGLKGVQFREANPGETRRAAATSVDGLPEVSGPGAG